MPQLRDVPLMQERPDQYGMGPIFGSQANFEHYQISRLLAQNTDQLADRECLVHVGYVRTFAITTS